MPVLNDALLYLCERYPHKHELSKARLTKMVYLADWRSAIYQGRQLTGLTWQFNHYGPYLKEVVETAKATPGLQVRSTENMYGGSKDLVERVGPMPAINLSDEDTKILDAVIETTKDLNWNDFIKLVYSTYPIVTQERYVDLDLPALAREYEPYRVMLGGKEKTA